MNVPCRIPVALGRDGGLCRLNEQIFVNFYRKKILFFFLVISYVSSAVADAN